MLTVVVVLSLSFKFVLLPPAPLQRGGSVVRAGQREDGTGIITREIGMTL